MNNIFSKNREGFVYMKLVSFDNFFSLGLNCLLSTDLKYNNSNVVIFHLAKRHDLILRIDDSIFEEEPLMIFLKCQRVNFNFNKGKITISNRSLYRTRILQYPKNVFLSDAEYIIISRLCKGINPRTIAMDLDISQKVVSSKKISALKKIGIKKVNVFLNEYFQWYILWNLFIDNKEANNFYTCQV